MNRTDSEPVDPPLEDDGPRVRLLDLLVWLGHGKRTVAPPG